MHSTKAPNYRIWIATRRKHERVAFCRHHVFHPVLGGYSCLNVPQSRQAHVHGRRIPLGRQRALDRDRCQRVRIGQAMSRLVWIWWTLNSEDPSYIADVVIAVNTCLVVTGDTHWLMIVNFWTITARTANIQVRQRRHSALCLVRFNICKSLSKFQGQSDKVKYQTHLQGRWRAPKRSVEQARSLDSAPPPLFRRWVYYTKIDGKLQHVTICYDQLLDQKLWYTVIYRYYYLHTIRMLARAFKCSSLYILYIYYICTVLARNLFSQIGSVTRGDRYNNDIFAKCSLWSTFYFVIISGFGVSACGAS